MLRAIVWTKALGARGFNPLPKRGLRRAGGKATLPDRAGDFSPRLAQSPQRREHGPRPDREKEPPLRSCRPSARPAGPRDAEPDRIPLDHPRRPFGRQLDGLPRDGARTSMGAGLEGEERLRCKNEKRLIWLDSIPDTRLRSGYLGG